jgi:hypothetical protein
MLMSLAAKVRNSNWKFTARVMQSDHEGALDRCKFTVTVAGGGGWSLVDQHLVAEVEEGLGTSAAEGVVGTEGDLGGE